MCIRDRPLEAVRFGLYGDSASGYDIYYRVLQNGSWTDWAANEATAGQEGAGLRVDGILSLIHISFCVGRHGEIKAAGLA